MPQAGKTMKNIFTLFILSKFFFCTALYLAQLDEGYVCDREKLYEIVNISDKVYVA